MMDVYLLMMVEVDEFDYSEVLSYKAIRRCRVFGGRRGSLRLCLGDEFDCSVARLI